MRNEFPPVVSLRLAVIRFHQPKISRIGIRSNVEAASVVIQMVFVVTFPAEKQDPGIVRSIGIDIPILRGHGVIRGDQDKAFRSTLADGAAKSLVSLFVDQLIDGYVVADPVPVNLKISQRGRILPRVKECPIVIRPDDITRHVWNVVGEIRAAIQIPKPDRVLPPTNCVDCIGQDTLTGSHFEPGDVAEVMALGHAVDIEKDLLLLFVNRRAAIDSVLLPLLDAPVVKEVPLAIRDRHIFLFDPLLDLFEKFCLQRLGVPKPLVQIRVLRLQICDYFWILALSEPIVVIHANATVCLKTT